LIKLRITSWVGHIACPGESRGPYRGLLRKHERKRPLRRPGVDGRVILRWIFRKWDMWVGIGSCWTGMGIGGGH